MEEGILMSQDNCAGSWPTPQSGFFVKPAYRTKSGKLQLAIYFQPAAVAGPNGERVMQPPKPLLIAANALHDPKTFLDVVVKALNMAVAD